MNTNLINNAISIQNEVKSLRFSAEGMKFLAKENQKEWFDDLISKIESLSSLSIFTHVQFGKHLTLDQIPC